jgi:molecular chaperone DnaK (HSP70)
MGVKAIGIDLGTTNSVAAHCPDDPRSPRVIANAFGENLTPSVVSIKRTKRQSRATPSRRSSV